MELYEVKRVGGKKKSDPIEADDNTIAIVQALDKLTLAINRMVNRNG